MAYIFNAICKLLQQDFAANTNSYYMAVSKYTPWADESNPDPQDGTYTQGDFNLRKQLMYGKRVASGDAAFLINNTAWTIDTVYDQYDDSDSDLFSKMFYVINSNSDVFKCISNNSRAVSTEEPVSKTSDIFQMADGYKWKYMFTLSSANNTKFGTTAYIPVDANTTIAETATPGTIDNIIISDAGTGYSKFATGTIQSVSNGNFFKISANNSGVADYYTGLMIYISSGTGDSSISRITQHFSNSSGIYITTANNMNLDFSSAYTIYPEIVIEGDGNGATAFCTVNLISQSLASVVVINSGSGYTSATVTANNTTGSPAVLRPVISPVTGHGSNAEEELFANRFIVITTFSGGESNSIPTELSFREYALIKNPKYANGVLYTNEFFDATISVAINIASSNTDFVIAEDFIGETSNAIGIVGFGNTTTIIGTVFSGAFSNGEIIHTTNSNVIGTISNINNPQINVYSGEILFYDTSGSIARSNSSLEDVGFILTNVSGN
jgi:hypothetical protein